MGTTIRPELSKRNPYWIEKHRYYELKHFCLQYDIWKKAYEGIDGFKLNPLNEGTLVMSRTFGDPTGSAAIIKEYYSKRISLIEDAAKETDSELCGYILKGITKGYSYDILKVRFDIPCCKEVYYNLYRKFFWILDKERA